MADIKDQLIKDSYNYVLQSDLSTGVVYRIGGTIPVNPIFSSGLTVNSGFTYSNGTEQPGYVLTTDGSGNAYWSSVSGGTGTSGNYLPLSGGTVTGETIFQSGLTANTISATTYYNLPTDVFVTGGTYNSGDAIFTNNTGGTFTVTGFTIGGGGGQLFYLNLSQSQGSNRLLSTTASTASEQTTGVTINNGVTGSIASFQSQPLNITLLPGGIWSFYLHSYKENNNASFDIFVEVYKRTSGGTQTLLFSTDPTPVTTNSPNPSMQLTDGYFSGTTLLVSDSIVTTVRATNTSNQSHTITLVTEGSTHYSYVVSTIPTQQGISGSGTSNYLPKWSGSTSLVNSLVYDSSTGVTIGTGFTWDNTNSRLGLDIPNPTSKLQIKGNGTTNATTTFITQNNSNSVNSTIYDDGTWFFGGSNTRLAAIPGQFDFNSAAGNISRIGHWEMFFRPLQAGSVSLELSTNIRMLNTNVLIGTSTDAGYKLDVNGSARFGSNFIWDNTNSALNVTNAIDSTNPFVRFISNATGYTGGVSIEAPNLNAAWNIFKVSSGGFTSFLVDGSRKTTIQSSSAATTSTSLSVPFGRVSFESDVASGSVPLLSVKNTGAYGTVLGVDTGAAFATGWYLLNVAKNGTTQFSILAGSNTIVNTGNFLVGTTTDAGVKLNVSGNTLLQGGLTANTISATTYYNLPSQSGITIGTTSITGGTVGQVLFHGTGNVVQETNSLTFDSSSTTGQLRFVSGGLVYSPSGAASWSSVSAGFEVQSTTKGFLQPRMTSAQRDAISSPATGLTVYQTTNNYLSLFNGTNWQNILSPNSNGNVLIGQTSDSGQKLQVSGNTLLQGGLTATTKTTIGSESDISCALLQMASTTQGVLFPRMTNAQRTSISSPVAGLMVYCTDSPEGLFIYKSTGWVQII
jgi:hypothetical protein